MALIDHLRDILSIKAVGGDALLGDHTKGHIESSQRAVVTLLCSTKGNRGKPMPLASESTCTR